MSVERKILLNLALRARHARKHWCKIRMNFEEGTVVEAEVFGRYLEAHNSFQAAKQIYFENKDK